jgi:hypothetical protein
MTNIDEKCKGIDAQHPDMNPSMGHVVPEMRVPLYGLFMIYQEMEDHSELICASDSKDKLKLKAYERESKHIYDETFDANDVLSLSHNFKYVIQQIEII